MISKNVLKSSATPRIAVIMGSESDLTVMQEAIEILKEFNIVYYCSVVSAHRTPDRMAKFAKDAKSKKIEIIIAGAGGAAHLPGMVAAYSLLPVIGVPIATKNLLGVDSLYSIVQMPKGVPVATMAINGAANAALLAIRILANNDVLLYKKLEKYQLDMAQKVALSAIATENKMH